jgi:hypothetical protein
MGGFWFGHLAMRPENDVENKLKKEAVSSQVSQ